MADFNWNDHPIADSESKGSQFNWNDHPVTHTPDEVNPDLANISRPESFIRSAIQVPLMGFEDEAVGGAKALYDVATTNHKMSDLENLYRAYRDSERNKNANAAKAHPTDAIAGTVAGSIGTALIPGLDVAALPTAMGVGAASGLGSSDADLTQGEIGQAAKDTAIGGAVGGVLNKTLPVISKGISGLGQRLFGAGQSAEQEAGQMAYKSLGASGPEMADYIAQGKNPNATGQKLSDVVNDYVSPSGGPTAAWDKINGRIQQIEAAKAPLFQSAEEQLQNLSPDKMEKLSSLNLSDKLDDIAESMALRERDLAPQEQVKLADQLKGMFKNYLSPLESLPEEGQVPQGISRDTNNLNDLNTIKQELGTEISQSGFNRADKMASGLISPNATLEAKRSAYDAVKNHIQEIGDIIGGDTGSQINALNKEESLLIGLRDTVQRTAGKEAASTGAGAGSGLAASIGANALGGLVGAGAAGATGHNTPGGYLAGAALGIGAKTGLEKFLGQGLERALTAKGSQVLGSAGSALQGIGNAVNEIEPLTKTAANFVQTMAGPGAISNTVQNGVVKTGGFTSRKDKRNLSTYDNNELSGVAGALNSSNDTKLQTYGQSLYKALQSGNDQAKNAAIFVIMQNPTARAQLGLIER